MNPRSKSEGQTLTADKNRAGHHMDSHKKTGLIAADK